MSDGEALRRAVLAEPDEDTPRLIYADWLDENGQGDRAAFIRDQIEAVRADPFGVQSRNASKRAAELRKKHRTEWWRPIREACQRQYPDFVAVQVSEAQANPLPDVVPVLVQFERGFVEHLTTHPDVFCRVAESVLVTEPIQSLKLFRFGTASESPLQPVYDLPQLQQIRRLEFAPGTEFLHDEYVALADSPHLNGLRDLCVRGCPIHPIWVVSVLVNNGFPELHGLDFAEIPNLGPSLVNAIARSNHREIRRLDVSGVVFNSDQLRQLLTSRCLRNVEELRLGCSGFAGAAGPLSHINPGWVIPCDRLVTLDLKGQRLGNEGVGEVVKQSATAALRWLGLAFNSLDSGVLRFFTESKHLSLNYLDVRGNSFTPSGIATLKARFPDAVIEV